MAGEGLTAVRTSPAREWAAQLWRVTGRIGLHEVVVVVVSFLIYFVIRGSVVGRAGEAMVRGIRLIELEQQLGIYWELEMQSWILDSYWLIKAMNWVYFWGHMPLIIVFAVWLYVWHRHTYTLVRNAFLASGAIAVMVYWLYPVAPPRLIPFAGFIDTMAMFDRVGYNAQETKGLVNPFAAVPSLHFGWSMLLGLAVAWAGKRPILWVFGVAWPVAMFFAVVMTGNHFILDAVIGGAVSFAGLGIAIGLERARPRVMAWAKGRSMLLLACALAGLAALSCDGDNATTGDEATPAPSFTATLSPSPAQTRLEELPAVVVVVRDAFLQRDVEKLVGLTSPVSLPCVTEVTDKVKGPVCPAGVSPGTAVQALPFAACQGGWLTEFAEAFAGMTERAGRLAVVAQMGKAPADWPQAYTYGELVLVFEPRDEPKSVNAVAIYVEDGRIVRAQNGCRTVEGFVNQDNPKPTVLWTAP